MNIRFLGAHNCESRTTRCICLLIDDTLTVDAGGLTSSLSIPEQENLGAILLTHQHYDHIRDVPAIALNLSQHGASIDIYCTSTVRSAMEAHLFNGIVYPEFQNLPEDNPTVRFNLIKPYDSQRINGHNILAVPVNHQDLTVGYQITDAEGKTIFYTADTGPGLMNCWQHLSPQLLIFDVTVPDRCKDFAIKTGHLTPSLLNEELIGFQKVKGYLPPVVIVHMEPTLEREIRDEIASVAEARNIPISIAYEGMGINV